MRCFKIAKNIVIILKRDQTVLPVPNDELLYHSRCEEIKNCTKTYVKTGMGFSFFNLHETFEIGENFT